jgi:siroheme synthase
MARRHLGEIVAALIEGGRDPATPAAVVEDGTLPSQRVTTTELVRLPAAAAGAVSPALVVIGEVVALRQRIDWFAGDPHGPGAASSATAFTRRSTSDSVL